MKSLHFYILLLSITSCTTPSEIEQIRSTSVLVFEDNFDSSTSIDTIKWRTTSLNPKPFDRVLPRGNCNFKNAAFLTDKNIKIENDVLNLIVRPENTHYKGLAGGSVNTEIGCNLKGHQTFDLNLEYTSASIFSKKGYNHGLFECRAKIPSTKGLYPVFWLWHHDEIVVFEFFGDSHNHFVSAHNKEKYVTKNFNDKDYSTDFHNYAVHWTNQKITWYVDDEFIWSICRDSTAHPKVNPLNSLTKNKEYNIKESFPDSINRWLSPNISLRIYEWAESVNNHELPDTLKIDYVRIYQDAK